MSLLLSEPPVITRSPRKRLALKVKGVIGNGHDALRRVSGTNKMTQIWSTPDSIEEGFVDRARVAAQMHHDNSQSMTQDAATDSINVRPAAPSLFDKRHPNKTPHKQPKQVGYGRAALDTSHIYGGDLFLESIFPKAAVPECNSVSRTVTGVSQQSPLWTPSLMEPDDGDTGERPTAAQQAPMPYVTASPLSLIHI